MDEYTAYVREEFRKVVRDEELLAILAVANVSTTDEVTLRNALGVALPGRLKGVSGNGAMPAELMRRFIVAKRESVYAAFQRYLELRAGAESAASMADTLEERVERTANVVRSRQ